MKPDRSAGSVWRHVWASAENEINKQKLESTMRSLAQTKQHKEKKVSAAAKDWELGVPFKDASSKSRATKLVLDALVASTRSNVTQATVVMSAIVSRLSVLCYLTRQRFFPRSGRTMLLPWIKCLNTPQDALMA
jgi:hypothetical protein